MLLLSCSDREYRKAVRSGNPRTISRYIETCESEKWKERASQRLEILYYRRANSEAACTRYINRYPEGKYVEEVKEKLEQRVFERAKESVFAAENYLRKYPEGEYRDHPVITEGIKKADALTRFLDAGQIDSVLNRVRNTAPEPIGKHEYAVIETRFGRMKLRFFPDKAPDHCANFKRLAESGYYDGVTFHRVIPGFMIQGGDILSRDGKRSTDGTGGPGYSIDAEFNDIPHTRGIVSMARTPDPNSAGSQFFICDGSPGHLDGQYTVFAEVIEGRDMIAKIANLPRDAADNPLEPVHMRVYMEK